MEYRTTYIIYSNGAKLAEVKAVSSYEAVDRFCNSRGLSRMYIKARKKSLNQNKP